MQKPLMDRRMRLEGTNVVVWFLGFGVGGAAGLALACALLAIWNEVPILIALAAILIATIHASILFVFWQYRERVQRRTAVLVSMLTSAVLTCLLAWMTGAFGMKTAPLYGLAFMHLVMAFCHPANFIAKKIVSEQSGTPK